MHVAFVAGDAINVWDVWESPEAFQTFADTPLMPGVAELDITGQPDVRIDPCVSFQRELIIGGRLVAKVVTVPPVDAYQVVASEVDWLTTPPIGAICQPPGA